MLLSLLLVVISTPIKVDFVVVKNNHNKNKSKRDEKTHVFLELKALFAQNDNMNLLDYRPYKRYFLLSNKIYDEL